MATFTQLASGNWRVQVRSKTRYVAETFRRRKDGEEWALEMERNIDRNGSSRPRAVRDVRTFGDLVDLHDGDMREVGKPPRQSKAAVMASLKAELGSVKLPALNREQLIEFGRKRAKQGAGSATLAIDLSFIRTIITHAAAVHSIEVSAEEARLARVALSHLNLVGKSKERDRRPTQDELDELIEYFETNRRQFIPMGRIVGYAVATTLRQEEICKPEWPLVDMKKRLVVIQDRKDPRNKDGNDQKVPLLNLTGYDAWEVVLQQRIVTLGYGRIFPHNHRSVSAAFTRICDELKIEDLHFHDLQPSMEEFIETLVAWLRTTSWSSPTMIATSTACLSAPTAFLLDGFSNGRGKFFSAIKQTANAGAEVQNTLGSAGRLPLAHF